MALSITCFAILLALSLGALMLGRALGTRSKAVAMTTLVVAGALVILCAVLRFKPALLHTMLPLDLSIWLEGTIATLPWMLLVGVVWTSEETKNLHRAAVLMAVLGVIYLLFGGMWMLLPTIDIDKPEDITLDGVTMQARGDTCVPSSCATALRRMGIDTGAQEMCRVTQAKPSRGSSLARAAWGLRRFLKPRGITVELLPLTAEEVANVARDDMPALIVIRSFATADHMVAVLGRNDAGIIIANPAPGTNGGRNPVPGDFGYGIEVYTPDDFKSLYRGAAIVFRRQPP